MFYIFVNGKFIYLFVELTNLNLFASSIKNTKEVMAKTVVESARQGNKFAQKIWNKTIHFLAIGLGSLIVILAPRA